MRYFQKIIWLLLFCALPALAGTVPDIEIAVNVQEGTVIVDTRFRVAVSPQEAWAVMTDFEHMDEFISNLESCKVISRSAEKVLVAQKGRPSRGLLSYTFEAVREYQLTPPEKIRSRVVSGNIKKFDGVTGLSADGSGTLVVSHAESIPNVWVPPIIGPAFIKAEVLEQVEEMRKEILRRKQVAAAAAQPEMNAALRQ